MLDILVIGLAGRGPSDDWTSLLTDRVIVARNGQAAAAALPPGTPIETTYDAVFELVDPHQAAGLIAEAIVDVAATANVAYLTPGFGSIGDAVVDRLRLSNASISMASVCLAAADSIAGPVTIIDALDVGSAEAAEPYIGGIPSLDPVGALYVSNWHAPAITALAARRISRTYPDIHDRVPNRDGFMFVPATDPLATPGSLAALEYIVARLRRDDGCPWDREQTAVSLLPALAEEADELRQAIEAHDVDNVIEELGDVLVNLLMQAQIAAEAGSFRFGDAITAATRKLVRRHPHVFGDARAVTTDEVLAIWRQVKADEKSGRPSAATSP